VSTATPFAKHAAIPNRPQLPQPPFPYAEQQVSFSSGNAQLSATLTLPNADGLVPAAVLVHGSGPHDRDETIFFHKPFHVLADFLTRHGIAVLRYDKRGIARSTGDHGAATTMDFADDAQAAVAFLSRHAGIDKKQIGLIGHSEGGIIAPVVASRQLDVAFIVLLGGTGVAGKRILLSQVAEIARVNGISKRAIARALRMSRRIYSIIESQPDNQEAAALIRSVAGTQEKDRLEAEIPLLTSNWFRSFLAHDPAPVLARVKCPVLGLFGSKDLQVVPALNLPAIAKALGRAGNEDITLRVFPGINHLFQSCRTGSPGEYAAIEETIAPIVLSEIASWIKQHVT